MIEQLAYTVAEAVDASRTSRTALYAAIGSGELRAVKRGRRTLILVEDLKRWLSGLAPVGSEKSA